MLTRGLLFAALTLTSCTDGTDRVESESTPDAEPESTLDAEPVPVAEIATAPVGDFLPAALDLQQIGLLVVFGDNLLADTEYDRDRMGPNPWGSMLRDSALGACSALAADNSTADAMRVALSSTPFGEAVPPSDDEITYDLLSVIFLAGVDSYCPDTANFGPGAEFDDGWTTLTGGDPPFRPVKLPDVREIPAEVFTALIDVG